MIRTFLEIAWMLFPTAYLVYWSVSTRRRRKFARDLLMSHIHPEKSIDKLGQKFDFEDEFGPAPDEKWNIPRKPQDLWSMYSKAGFILEFADTAAQCCKGVDEDLIASLRRDAMHVRTYALLAVSTNVCSQMRDSALIGAARAAAYHAEMLDKTAQLLQQADSFVLSLASPL